MNLRQIEYINRLDELQFKLKCIEDNRFSYNKQNLEEVLNEIETIVDKLEKVYDKTTD